MYTTSIIIMTITEVIHQQRNISLSTYLVLCSISSLTYTLHTHHIVTFMIITKGTFRLGLGQA